jgi:hypothetical protein
MHAGLAGLAGLVWVSARLVNTVKKCQDELRWTEGSFSFIVVVMIFDLRVADYRIFTPTYGRHAKDSGSRSRPYYRRKQPDGRRHIPFCCYAMVSNH